MPKYWGKQIFTHGSFPRSGSKAKDGEKREKEVLERKLVITMASYALQRHLVWRTQSRLGQFCKECQTVSFDLIHLNNGIGDISKSVKTPYHVI